MTHYSQSGSVVGEAPITYVVGHGPFPAFSAQGKRVVQVNFHPAQSEYTGDPHDGQYCGGRQLGYGCVHGDRQKHTLLRVFQSTRLLASAKIAASNTSKPFIATRGSEKASFAPAFAISDF